ncbi:MAG: glycoside hydrolase family 2 TIM barrel-domain containing protein [Oscillospiraceae bacterium]
MRNIINLDKWLFTKTDDINATDWQNVNVPHTWNNKDGQDGDGDYYRGRCWYRLALPALPLDKEIYVEFDGVNHIAEVYLNGEKLGTHEGGFSTFRFEIGSHLKDGENILSVSAYNGEGYVYPQMADFTFFGGMYRAAHIIIAEKAHFDLTMHGSSAVFVTPKAQGDSASVRIDAFTVNGEGCEVKAEILDESGKAVATAATAAAKQSTLELSIENAHRWNSMEDPYLYSAKLTLVKNGEALDEIITAFGVREYSVDAETGFILNGKSYPLHGVSRHQDRIDMGWALTRKEHAEDAAIIKEVGANTIRLAHYQHAEEFYSICDETGFVLWAEIPFISMFIADPRARENTLSQMTELVMQKYNHPSICFWGISNEISMGGETPELLDNLKAVNALCKKLDPSRLTTMAHLTMVENESPMHSLTDVLSYNHYFGWYIGDVSENGPALDAFHKMHPTRPVGVSEYGAEANLALHSAHPHVHDYSEEYQAYYHENMLKTFAERPYLWSTHVWNMFDFAADARDEGGCKGRNNKGLVTYDRKTRKDSFYIYKAYWTKEPFVHITGRRFIDRISGKTDIKVYSNCPSVSLSVNGAEPITLEGDKVFIFKDMMLNLGENTFTAYANGAENDTIKLKGCTEANPSYTLPEENDSDEGVENWFEGKLVEKAEMQFPEGYFSIRDTVGEIAANAEAMKAMSEMMGAAMGGGEGGNGGMMKTMLAMMKDRSLESLLKMAGKRVPNGAKQMINAKLNEIKKG